MMGLDHQSSNLIHTRNNVLFFGGPLWHSSSAIPTFSQFPLLPFIFLVWAVSSFLFLLFFSLPHFCPHVTSAWWSMCFDWYNRVCPVPELIVLFCFLFIFNVSFVQSRVRSEVRIFLVLIFYSFFFLSWFSLVMSYGTWAMQAWCVCDFSKSFILDLNLMIVMTILSIIRSLCSRLVRR